MSESSNDFERGKDGSVDAQFPELYRELRKIAARHLRGARSGDTFQPTVLLHETYLKMANSQFSPQDRVHLLATASTVMRHILVDHARARKARKRAGDLVRVLIDTDAAVSAPALDILFIHDALSRLAEWDERQAKVVEFKFFAGLTNEEIADLIGTSAKTVQRDWAMARAWLQEQLKSCGSDE